ncbi:MAG: hypothetical protein EXS08_12500 [Planctomycetes bacterium]|nr:hypothetical protein [Planctomycetota bacterium]
MTSHARCWMTGLLLLAGTACSHAGSSAEIVATRRASQASSPVLKGATAARRFGTAQMGAPESGSDNLIDYDLPPGWQALPLTGERLIDLRPGGDPEASCYLSFLGGPGGGLAENVNRWRKQLGAEPLAENAILALPTHPVLTREATLVEVEGTFVGMGETPRPGHKLLGLIVSDPTGSLFLKFTAPAARVDAERERFLTFASSLRTGAEHAHGAAAQPEVAMAPPGAMTWKAPAGWAQQPPRMMREVSFAIGNGGECYISRLGAGAGGLRTNLDRWRDQFGLAPMSDTELAALQPVPILGLRAPLVELDGSYAGMSGKPVPAQALLGVALFRAQDSLFVKFTGPAEVVHAERANFLAFLASLAEDS